MDGVWIVFLTWCSHMLGLWNDMTLRCRSRERKTGMLLDVVPRCVEVCGRGSRWCSRCDVKGNGTLMKMRMESGKRMHGMWSTRQSGEEQEERGREGRG